MFRSLLVPLDGSVFAEGALPLAALLARRAGARLQLVRVHTPYALDDPLASRLRYEPEREVLRQEVEQRYLDGVAARLAAALPGPVSTAVLPGSTVVAEAVAEGLLERLRDSAADLVVMATHGRRHLGAFGPGCVADELLRRAVVPLLLVRSGEGAAELLPEPAVRRLLVPLDGSPLAEGILGPAAALARLTGAHCTLLGILKDRSCPLPGAPGPKPEKAEAYLGRMAARCQAEGVPASAACVVAPHAAEAILDQAAARAADAIALATHGRHGLRRLILGSVTAQVLRAAAGPVLVVRPGA